MKTRIILNLIVSVALITISWHTIRDIPFIGYLYTFLGGCKLLFDLQNIFNTYLYKSEFFQRVYRGWYLIFYKKRCIKLTFNGYKEFGFIYISAGGVRLRYIGNGWYYFNESKYKI